MNEDITTLRRRDRIFDHLHLERLRQERLKEAGKFTYTCADPSMLNGDRYLVLGEEFGEVGRAVLNAEGLATDYHGRLEKVREELIQLAAVAVAWVEFIDKVLPVSSVSTGLATLGENQRTDPEGGR